MTPSQAATVLSLIEGMSARRLIKAKALSAVEALHTLSRGNIADIYVYCAPNQKINCIKLTRAITGLGLKEAKDLVDDMTNRSSDGWIGPIKRTANLEVEKARIVSVCQDNHMDMSFVRFQSL